MLIRHLTSIEVIEMSRILTDSHLEEECRRLSHGGNSGMNRALDLYHTIRKEEGRPVNAKGIFAKYAKTYIGWALWTRERDNYSFVPCRGQVAFQIFVAHEYRRKGIGTMLFQAAQRLVDAGETLRVYYYSNPNFFQPFKAAGLCGEVL